MSPVPALLPGTHTRTHHTSAAINILTRRCCGLASVREPRLTSGEAWVGGGWAWRWCHRVCAMV